MRSALAAPILAALLALVACTPAAAPAAYGSTPAQAPTGTVSSAKQAALHDGMRKLWEDHITWTRLYIVSFAANLPDADATAGRLLQNQADIGDAIKPYYGDSAGTALTGLLRTHILGAVDVLKAAKVGDAKGFDAANAKWYENGDAIASFLSGANPNWPAADLKAMMKMHLDLTLAEA